VDFCRPANAETNKSTEGSARRIEKSSRETGALNAQDHVERADRRRWQIFMLTMTFAGVLGDRGVEPENQDDKDERCEVDAALFVVEIGVAIFARVRVSIGRS
jgi:hypothetical protein